MSKIIQVNSQRTLSHYVKHKNGKVYYVDSANTLDKGFETMVFKAEEFDSNDYDVKCWNPLYSEWYNTERAMEEKHIYIIEHLEEFIKE